MSGCFLIEDWVFWNADGIGEIWTLELWKFEASKRFGTLKRIGVLEL